MTLSSTVAFCWLSVADLPNTNIYQRPLTKRERQETDEQTPLVISLVTDSTLYSVLLLRYRRKTGRRTPRRTRTVIE